MRPATYTASSGATAITGAEEVNYTYHAQGYLATIQTESTTYSFTYDAFGNKTTKYHATDTGGGVSTNYIGYRGYYYDFDLGLYFTQTISNQLQLFQSLKRKKKPKQYLHLHQLQQ